MYTAFKPLSWVCISVRLQFVWSDMFCCWDSS